VLTCKQIAATLNVSVTKATQAWAPARRKVAAMLHDHPAETLAELADEIATLADERERAIAADLERQQQQFRERLER
jgi:hypothetical protein